MTNFLGPARQQLDRVKALCRQVDLQYVDIHLDFEIGVGIGIGFGETDYSVCSVMNSASHLIVTSGILRGINQDRATALEYANRFNQGNSSYTVFVHDSQAEWSLLVQRMTPVEVMTRVPEYFSSLVRGLPLAVQEFRPQLASETAIGGQPWTWTPQDLHDLLLRSMI